MFISQKAVMFIGFSFMIFAFGRGRQHKFTLNDGLWELVSGLAIAYFAIFFME